MIRGRAASSVGALRSPTLSLSLSSFPRPSLSSLSSLSSSLSSLPTRLSLTRSPQWDHLPLTRSVSYTRAKAATSPTKSKTSLAPAQAPAPAPAPARTSASASASAPLPKATAPASASPPSPSPSPSPPPSPSSSSSSSSSPSSSPSPSPSPSSSQSAAQTPSENSPLLQEQLRPIRDRFRIQQKTLDTFGVELSGREGKLLLRLPYFDTLNQKHYNTLEFNTKTPPSQMEWPASSVSQREGFFGLGTAMASDSRTLLLANNDLDALSLYQKCGLPTISLSNQNEYPKDLKTLFSKFDQIYLWFRQDSSSQRLAQQISSEIGPFKCINVEKPLVDMVPSNLSPHEALAMEIDFGEVLKESEQRQQKLKTQVGAKVLPSSSLTGQLLNEILYPRESVESKWLPGLNKISKGLRMGEITIFSGSTGVGKTSLMSQLSLDYCLQGVPTLWGSFEIRQVVLMKKMLFQFKGKDLSSSTESELRKHLGEFNTMPLHMLDYYGSIQTGELFEILHYAIQRHGIRHVILDNLQFMLSETMTRSDVNKFDIQDRVLHQLRKFVNEHNVHISVVVHPKKVQEGQPMTNDSISGTAKATQEADNVFLMLKFPENTSPEFANVRVIRVTKNRFDGELGTVVMKYDKSSHKYIEVSNELKKTVIDKLYEQRPPYKPNSSYSSSYSSRN